MNGIQINSRTIDTNSDGQSITWEIQFPPQFVVAWVTLAKVDTPDGNIESGVVQFRQRTPSGADTTTNLDTGPFSSLNAVSAEQMTSVTFELWVAHGLGKAQSVISFW
jgi:hypothetical protein